MFGQFGTKSDLVLTLHPIEVIFLVFEKECFIFYETKQICVQAFFDLFFKEFGKEGLDLFLVYFHFLKKAWCVSIDRKGFQRKDFYLINYIIKSLSINRNFLLANLFEFFWC